MVTEEEMLEVIRREVREALEEKSSGLGHLELISGLYLALAKKTRQLEHAEKEIEKLRAEVKTLRSKFKQSVEKEESTEGERHPILEAHIMESGLPLKIAQPLHYGKYEFENLGQVIRFTKKELLTIRGFGGKRLCELEAFLESHGLKLKK